MTRHPAASAVSASRPAAPAISTHAAPPPEGLCRPPEAIFDAGAVRADLAEAIAAATGPKEVRAAAAQILTAARKRGMAAIQEALEEQPRRAAPITHSIAWLTDCIVTMVLEVCSTHLHPQPNSGDAERIAIVAVGGYGRGEMAPHSDVDLLFLTPHKMTPWAESLIESMLYLLWDLKLKIGHASRTIKDCLRLAREDYTIRTTLLETRHLVGDPELTEELTRRLRRDLFTGTESDFVAAKLKERDERHRKQGGQRYVVEPNVKEGKGGLRDLQSLYWIGKYVYDARSASALVRKGVFRPEEYAAFAAADDFLWAVRCHLHVLAGRAMDQLTFDLQVEVAERMGYRDKGGRRAVEHFMTEYFRHATQVGELTRIMMTAQEALHIKAAPMLANLVRRRPRVKPPYGIRQNRLTVEDEALFLADKLNILRIFEQALRTGTLVHADSQRLVAANLDLIDDDMREDRTANRLFVDLLLKHGNPERALRRMNEIGVLGAFIPEWHHIVAMVQYNMYHHYTVDEHTIQAVSTLAQIERGLLKEELPIASRILEGGVNRKVLYVAVLLHDIGKGRDEDHSILGAQIVRRVGPRLGLSKKEVETVEWLVRYHLLMSDMAQKRDISDPRTVRDFAKLVKSKERLDLLTVLTVCDIRGVGPGTWNNWKAMLIRGLYRGTEQALANGLEALNRTALEAEAKRDLRAAMEGWDAREIRAEIARHYGPYWQGLPTEAHLRIAEMLRELGPDEIRIDLHPDEDRDATRVLFSMADHPGIFSRVTGALALAGANVVDARIYTTRDGFANAAYWVQDAEGHPYEAERLPRLHQTILRTLKGEVVTRDAIRGRDKIKKREARFTVPTSITFDNDASDIFTVIEVDTRDRPGLLYDLTRQLANMNVYISSAVIATYGEQAVDTFYVKDMFGLKFLSEGKRAQVEKRLREAITVGAERARA
ncbi:[protein-PII] uridylyltransferase [Pseudoroseicyclus tamaricis]|uniref:Bifunctional uridylyltransferase/uridylyl-removing enzyme n=1 Tax=Pseudoroseicyclus tamaricis TaxID=2705421 RepID=A0A6B2K194_9RHOB|nr:[protein-PII] uridylyltransferase [Pseudoroseicyclus tamaricis]NDV00106.1 [protein-PII] uridylyltransferase [Pseudoroseicyclus tamaricis]